VAKAQEDLHQRIKTLEDELRTVLEEKERAFRYNWVKGKAKFEKAVLSEHKKLKYWLPSYIIHSRFLAVITAPVIYAGFFPFCLLDLFLAIYQLTYAQELSIARPPEMNTHLGTPKILR
jgi:hypothetical protein